MQKIKIDDIKTAFSNLLENKYTEQMYFDYTYSVSHSELNCGVHTLGYLYLNGFKDKESREKAICDVLDRFKKITGHNVEDYKFSSQLTGHGSDIFPHTLEERKFCIALYYLTLKEALDKKQIGDEYKKELDIQNNPKFGKWIEGGGLVRLVALATKKPAILFTDTKGFVLVSRYNNDSKRFDDSCLYLGPQINDCKIGNYRKVVTDEVKSAVGSEANIILLRNKLYVYDNAYDGKKYFGTNLVGYYQPVRPEKNKEFVDAMIKNFICSDGMFCRNYIIDRLPQKLGDGNIVGLTENKLHGNLANNCDKILKISGIENIIHEAQKLDNADDDLQQEKKYDLLKKIVFRFGIMFESDMFVVKYVNNILKSAGMSDNNELSMINTSLWSILCSESDGEQKQEEIDKFINSLTMIDNDECKNKIKNLLSKIGTWTTDYLTPVVASNVISILESKNIPFGANAFQVAEKSIANIFNSKPENKCQAINYFLNQLPIETDKETRKQIKDLVCSIFLDGIEQEKEKWPQNKIFAGLLKTIDETNFDNISDAEKKLNKAISDLKKDNDRCILINEKPGDPDNLSYCPAVVITKKLLEKDKNIKLDFQSLLCLSYLIGIRNNDFDEFNATSLALRKICEYKNNFDDDKVLAEYFLSQIKLLDVNYIKWHYLDYFWLFKLLSDKLFISFTAFDILKELIPNGIEANFVLRMLVDLGLKNCDDANKVLDFLIDKIKDTKNYNVDLNQAFFVIDKLNRLDENLSVKLVSKLIKSGCVSFDVNDILKLYGDNFLAACKQWIETIKKAHELIKTPKKEDQGQKIKLKEDKSEEKKSDNNNLSAEHERLIKPEQKPVEKIQKLIKIQKKFKPKENDSNDLKKDLLHDELIYKLINETDNYFKNKSRSDSDVKEIKTRLKKIVNLVDTYGAFNKLKEKKDSWIEKIEKADKINILMKIWFGIRDLFKKIIMKLSSDKQEFISGTLVYKLNKLESIFNDLKLKVPVINKKNISADKGLT